MEKEPILGGVGRHGAEVAFFFPTHFVPWHKAKEYLSRNLFLYPQGRIPLSERWTINCPDPEPEALFLTCCRKPILTTTKETSFSFCVSVTLIQTDRLLHLKKGESLCLAFHLGWSGNFQNFLLLFPLRYPSWPSSTWLFPLVWDLLLICVTKEPCPKFFSHFQVLVMGLYWSGGKQSFVFVSDFSTAGDPWGVYELLCRGERVHWHGCVFHCHDENCLEALNVGPGDQGLGCMATWLQMVKHQPQTGITFDFMFMFFRVNANCIFWGRKDFAKAVSLDLLEGLIKIRFKKLLEPGSRIHTHV